MTAALYQIKRTSRFKKDVARLKKQGVDLSLLETVVDLLSRSDAPLDAKYLDHPLQGKEKGFRECHIKDDWLLKYVKDKNTLVLVLTRTGRTQNVRLIDLSLIFFVSLCLRVGFELRF